MEPESTGPDRKAMIAILLCALIWAVWMQMSYTRTAEQKARQAAAQTPTAVATSGGSVAVSSQPAPSATPAAPETVTTLENKVLALKLTSHGARPVSADLKNYRENTDSSKEAGLVQLVEPAINGSPAMAPLAPWLGDDRSSRVPVDAPFEVVDSKPDKVSFRWSGADGLGLTRTFSTSPDDYLIDLTEEVSNGGAAPLTFRPGAVWATNLRKNASRVTGYQSCVASIRDGHAQRDTPKAGAEVTRNGPIDFVGVDDRYFAALVAPVDREPFAEDNAVHFWRPAGEAIAALAVGKPVTLNPGQHQTFHYLLYLGPKDYPVLLKAGHHLDKTIDWGYWWIVPISKALYYVLGWFQSWSRNWGLAIILMTLVIRGLLSPLAARQMKMANEMAAKSAKVKPQLDRLKEKLKDDPMELNRQTMLLYRQHGISMTSQLYGCLPMLLQLPIWWALYRVLWTSFDLRQAPFGLWIHDLSAPDIAFTLPGTSWGVPILPFLLGAVTFVQMRLTPASPGMDPAQQKMMQTMMPLMFTVPMLYLPSGLTLYIFTSTLINIAQQWYLRRVIPPAAPPIAAQREAT